MKEMWSTETAPQETATDEEKAQHAQRVAEFTWCVTSFLCAAAGNDAWGDDVRPYHLITDTMDANGKQKVRVTTVSEAFALLVYENCYPKWIAGCEWKKKNPKKTVPSYKKDNEETHCFATKWTDKPPKGGTKWTNAMGPFQANIAMIKEFRAEDAKNDKVVQKRARGLIKTHYDIGEDETEPANKRRRTSEGGMVNVPQEIEITYEDE